MINKSQLSAVLQKHQSTFRAVVAFNPANEKLLLLDFTESNTELTAEILNDSNKFSDYISRKLSEANCKYGIGGYDEHRTIYDRSDHFDASLPGEERRRLHLATDIWGEAYTAVIAPIDGIVHSFAFNNKSGDYGATIILTHNLDGISFHTLYGHLSLNSLKNISDGDLIKAGTIFAEFGTQFENGQWPPHLHFQIIVDMQGWKGDYPGVCKFSEKKQWLNNSPDPDLIILMNGFVQP
jgi:peptidoglycan LD-endopeptidase LytH